MTQTPEAFFYEHAGYFYPVGASPRERTAARRNNARALARAERAASDAGMYFVWERNPEITSADWLDDDEDGGRNRDPWGTWVCLMLTPGTVNTSNLATIVQSQHGVDFGRDVEPYGAAYARVVQADLAAEWLASQI